MIAACIGFAVIVAINWQGGLLGLATLGNNPRPTLLAGAEWNVPDKNFARRFHRGTNEKDLLDWLHANRFEIAVDKTAHRIVGGIPCAEAIDVSWSAQDSRLIQANAVVRESGCL